MKTIPRLAALLAIVSAVADIHAAPHVISSCTTITKPGSYVLDRNLASGGDCIRITTSYVTLDLDGYTIAGNGTGFGIGGGPPGAGLDGLTVRNGSVSNFQGGIRFGSDYAVVERMHVAGSLIVGIAVARGIVRDNVVINNPNHASISVDQAVVTGNLVINGSHSFLGGIHNTGASTITGNVVAWAHVQIDGIGIATVSGNTVYGGSVGSTGIRMMCPSAILGNTAISNLGNLSFPIGSNCALDHNAAP